MRMSILRFNVCFDKLNLTTIITTRPEIPFHSHVDRVVHSHVGSHVVTAASYVFYVLHKVSLTICRSSANGVRWSEPLQTGRGVDDCVGTWDTTDAHVGFELVMAKQMRTGAIVAYMVH